MQLLGEPLFLPGCGFGLTQAVLLVGVQVAPVEAGRWAVVAATLGSLIEAERTAASAPEVPLAPSANGTAGLVLNALCASVAALYGRARVPIAGQAKILGVQRQACGMLHAQLAMPWLLRTSALALLHGLIELFNQLLLPQAGSEPATGRHAAVVDAVLDPVLVRLRSLRVPGSNAEWFLRAAQTLDIPTRKLARSVVAFGHGHRQRWLESSFSDRTSVLGVSLSRSKHHAAKVLRDHGFPVPPHQLVADVQQALAAAARLGYPVVVKPADLDGGKGVSADLRDEAALRSAYALARRHSAQVLVERHVPGQDHRLTVVGGRLVKAVRRVPGGVTGDGLHSVATLIDLANAEPSRARRNAQRGQVLLALDDEALGMLAERGVPAGQAGAHVPAAGEYVSLRRRANISAGGEPQLVTHLVHPDNQRLAERAAQTLRLDFAGVDLIIEDISQSWLHIGGGICEVNAQPQIGQTTTPALFAELLGELMQGDGRIPVVAILSEQPDIAPGSVARQLQGLFAQRGCMALIASPAGVHAHGEVQLCRPATPFVSAIAALNALDAQAVIMLARPQDLARSGLPFDRCHALVLDAASTAEASSLARLGQVLQMCLPHATLGIVLHESEPGRATLATRIDAARLHPLAVSAPAQGHAVDAQPGSATALGTASAAAARNLALARACLPAIDALAQGCDEHR